jgi:glycosyltransferase involved in cell wall biosynthesis
VVLFVADHVDEKRKGFGLLVRALDGLGGPPDYVLVSLGASDAPLSVPGPHVSLGATDDDRRLALAYAAADVFVNPALQDNMPATVLESLACGTPVVGFDAGGVRELIRPGVTGTSVEAGSVDGLRRALQDALRGGRKTPEASARCRRVAVAEYSLDVVARRYASLYTQLAARADVGGQRSGVGEAGMLDKHHV